jgi:hypothetical protein
MSTTLNIWKRKQSPEPTTAPTPVYGSPAPAASPAKDPPPHKPAPAAKPSEVEVKREEVKQPRVPFPSRLSRRLAEHQIRNQTLTINVSPEERDYFWDYCKTHDIAFGAWARTVLLSAVRRNPPKNLRAANGSARISRAMRGRSRKGEKGEK